MNFKKWLEETSGQDFSRLNSEDPRFVAAGCRSRFGASGYPGPKLGKDKTNPLLGFMKAKMKKK